MGEYRCEGIGSVNGGTYDKLHVEGVFTAKGPIKANSINGEGVMNFSALCAEDLTLEGVTKVNGLLEAGSCSAEGVLKAAAITVSGSLYSDGVVNTGYLKAGNATLRYNHKKESPRPFARFFSFISGQNAPEENNAKIRKIEANTLALQDYSVQNIIGQDITIGKGCIVDKVQANRRLRIHKSAIVQALCTSVAAEYFE